MTRKRKQQTESELLLDQFITKYSEETGEKPSLDLLQSMTKRVIERALDAEMEEHLGYEKHAIEGRNTGNSRNGTTSKTVQSHEGKFTIDVPRDRSSDFEPQLVKKGQRRLGRIEDAILLFYARGQTLQDIKATLLELYDVEVPEAVITRVTNRVHEEITSWQNRPLDSIYPIVYLDGIVVKTREDGSVSNRTVYVALGVNTTGHKEILGLWMAATEGAKFWMSVISDLQNRGVEDILIACVDGLKGFEEAIQAIYPETEVQQCIVHQVRHSLAFVSWKDRKEVATDLRKIYTAPTRESGMQALEEFGSKWDEMYPTIRRSWDNNWARLSVFFSYSKDIRKVIYTTNAIESVNSSIRKNLKSHKLFPDDRSALKVVYLSIMNASKNWTMPIQNWKPALNQLIIRFGERLERHLSI